MRIIAGKYRGKNLLSPNSDKVRPTSDKARQAIFNILHSRLGTDFSHLKLLDIFSGTGAFSLEALSQGFFSVTMVDIDTSNLIKNTNLFKNEANRINIVRTDATKYLNLSDKFDILFMDAPYTMGLSEPALLNAKPYLKDQALCIIEVEKNETISLPLKFELIEERRYGLAKFIIAQFIC